MKKDQGWLASFLDTIAVSVQKYKGDPLKAVWLHSKPIAKTWMHYVSDTEIPDLTTPPSPTRIKFSNPSPNKVRITWQARADIESGLSHFIIKKNGKIIGQVPEKLVNRYGRPLFQGLLYSDTPTQPLNVMEFIDEQTEELNQYEIIAVNTVGLASKPSVLITQQKK